MDDFRPPNSTECKMNTLKLQKVKHIQHIIPCSKSKVMSSVCPKPPLPMQTDQPSAVDSLNDGLTKFFTPSNKRKSRVSSVSLEGIAAKGEVVVKKACKSARVTSMVTQKSRHHQAASKLIRKSHNIQRNQINKKRKEHVVNSKLRTVAALQDGLSNYFTVRGKRKSLFRKTEESEEGERDYISVSSEEITVPAVIKVHRRSSRGDHVELLYDGLTHLFTARGKRPSAFRKPASDSEKTGRELIKCQKRQHRHRSQVQGLVDGLSIFFTARSTRRLQDVVKIPDHVHQQKLIDTKGDNCCNSTASELCLTKQKTEDSSLQKFVPESCVKRIKISGSTLSSSRKAANQIAKRSRQFKVKRVGRRRGESCQLKALYDGLSHLYTAQGERQRKSFNFYCQTVQRRHSFVTGSRPIFTTNSKESRRLLNQTKSSSSSNSGSVTDTQHSNRMEKIKLDMFRAKNNALKTQPMLASYSKASKEKTKKWSHAGYGE